MKKLLLFVLLLVIGEVSFSQISYVAADGIATAGVYTDLGTNGTVINTADFDDAYSSAENIGFTFYFNGSSFTQFILNTNGFIKLGSIVSGLAGISDALASPETNLLYALNLDLEGGTAPEYRVYTSGTAPLRICTIQFKNVRDYSATTHQFQDMDFQIRLFESTNNIEYVYGDFVAGTAPSALTYTDAGIKGDDAANSVNLTKAAATAWLSGQFIDGGYTGNQFNINNSVMPISGTTYRFVYAGLSNNDAMVSQVYALGKVPSGYGAPAKIESVIKNTGALTLNNLAVTVTVTGANTFTNTQVIASLASGASVTVAFPGFDPLNTGVNNIAVTVPADGDNSNNSTTINQDVTGGVFSYADNSPATGSIGFGIDGGIIATKYTLTGSGYITNVNVFISNDANSVNNTVFAVLLDAAGNIIGRSLDFVVTAGDLNAYKNLEIVTPPSISNTDFYVGLAQTANTVTGYSPVGTQTEAIPARSGAYYTTSITGGTLPDQNGSLGRFMIEAWVSASPLPLKLISFTGKLVNNIAYLDWVISSAANNDRFEIERSPADLLSWAKTGTVVSAGNITGNMQYQFIDGATGNIKWLYRLKMIDKDGRYTYSPVILLQGGNSSSFVLGQNYPNPVKDITVIPYQLDKEALVTIEMYAMDGRKIGNLQSAKQFKGAYNIPVNTAAYGLANGKYIYRLIVKYASGEMISSQKQMSVVR